MSTMAEIVAGAFGREDWRHVLDANAEEPVTLPQLCRAAGGKLSWLNGPTEPDWALPAEDARPLGGALWTFPDGSRLLVSGGRWRLVGAEENEEHIRETARELIRESRQHSRPRAGDAVAADVRRAAPVARGREWLARYYPRRARERAAGDESLSELVVADARFYLGLMPRQQESFAISVTDGDIVDDSGAVLAHLPETGSVCQRLGDCALCPITLLRGGHPCHEPLPGREQSPWGALLDGDAGPMAALFQHALILVGERRASTNREWRRTGVSLEEWLLWRLTLEERGLARAGELRRAREGRPLPSEWRLPVSCDVGDLQFPQEDATIAIEPDRGPAEKEEYHNERTTVSSLRGVSREPR